MKTPLATNPLTPEPPDQTNRNLPPDFVRTIFASCSIRFDPDTHLPISSHETLFLTPHHHKNPLMFIELPQDLWDSPTLDEVTGNLEHLTWQPYHNLDALTILDFQKFPAAAPIFLPHPLIIPGRLIPPAPPETPTPTKTSASAPSIQPKSTPASHLEPIPTFRLATPDDPATHLLAKIFWQLPDITPDTSEYEIHAAIANHEKLADSYANQARTLFPDAHYWHAMNLNSPCGVDYWLLPIINPQSAL